MGGAHIKPATWGTHLNPVCWSMGGFQGLGGVLWEGFKGWSIGCLVVSGWYWVSSIGFLALGSVLGFVVRLFVVLGSGICVLLWVSSIGFLALGSALGFVVSLFGVLVSGISVQPLVSGIGFQGQSSVLGFVVLGLWSLFLVFLFYYWFLGLGFWPWAPSMEFLFPGL